MFRFTTGSLRTFLAATAFAAVLAAPTVSRAAECASDSDCGSGAWCQTSTGACVERVANGQPCTTNDGCTGGVCGSDGKCGGVNGQAVCTQPEEDGECRSGACSSSGVCVPHIGGCWLDSDCPNAQFCNRTSYACTDVLADGEALPNDGLHELCVAGEPNDACRSGSCDPSTKTCGSQAPTADVVTKDAGTTSQAAPAASADAGEGNAESTEKSSTTSTNDGSDESNANGMACSSSGTSGPSGTGGLFDLLVVAGGLLVFRRATAKAIASSRTDRRRSPVE